MFSSSLAQLSSKGMLSAYFRCLQWLLPKNDLGLRCLYYRYQGETPAEQLTNLIPYERPFPNFTANNELLPGMFRRKSRR
jgi:hypothetical protein